MKQKVKMSCYSEDGASVYSVNYWIDDSKSYNGRSFKKIKKLYIDETKWMYNNKDTNKQTNDFIKMINEKYEVEK